MEYQKTDNTNFRAKTFRVPVKAKKHKRGINNLVNINTVSGKQINPAARNPIGQSELKDISITTRFRNWYESKVLKRILKDEWQ